MQGRGISSNVGVRSLLRNRLRVLPKRSISDGISDDQADPMFEVDKAKNLIKREQIHRIMRCMRFSPNNSYLRCVWEHL